jgi:hypothetical protein
MKTRAPARNTLRIPKRSPNRPPNTMSAPRGNTLAMRIHWPVATDPPREWVMCGMASGTAV